MPVKGSPSRKVTLADIAQVAAVSTATVSRVVSGSAEVKPDLRDRILRAAAELGFDTKRSKKSKIIAFLLCNRGVLHPFHSAVLTAAEAYCAERGYGVLFLSHQYPLSITVEEVEAPEILEERQVVSGVILAGTNSQSLLTFLSNRRVPWVVLGNNVVGPSQEDSSRWIYFEDISSSYEMTMYLHSLGHRHIAFVGNILLPWYKRRFEGYRRAMEELKLDLYVSSLNSGEGEELGYLETKWLLQHKQDLTAIFAGDDAAAGGAYKAARDAGLEIPEDLSIAGFNDTSEALSLHPPLTSVHVFTDQLGKQLAETLLLQLEDAESKSPNFKLPTRLIRRESCAPPCVRQGRK
jgi:DNA-binding LacI/PurR family transcriptional regulator